jgi:hypothetical protein
MLPVLFLKKMWRASKSYSIDVLIEEEDAGINSLG